MSDDEDDDKLDELRDILSGTQVAKVVPLRPRPMAAARDGLAEELRPHFDALVADWHAAAYFGAGPAALPDYRVLADLVRAGWRKPGARG
jgi:hypothetical protein